MRKLFAAILVAGAALISGQAKAADFPEYPPVIQVPDVDYGVQGSFYLRGSAAGNAAWSKEVTCACGAVFQTDSLGYGYSYGAGFGYETGTGLRFDATIDSLGNSGAGITKATGNPAVDGKYTLNLRSTIALANIYYDFSFGGGNGYSAAGGAFGYVGAGVGGAYNDVTINSPATNPTPVPGGTNWSLAAAGMVGVGYDLGRFTADLGYRGIYLSNVSNGLAAPNNFSSANNWIHEVRTSIRYRIN